MALGPVVPHPSGAAPGTGAVPSGRQPVLASHPRGPAFHQIIIPDLVVIDPNGLSARQVTALGKLRGIRNAIAVDGARITTGGQQVNLLGVNPEAFRSWTPLSTASDEQLWTALDHRQFVASARARHRLGLHRGRPYVLTGGAPETLGFGGAAQFGVAGIDLLVSNRSSAGLGLIHNVGVLVSAPGLTMARLTREVRRVTGRQAKLTSERQRGLPVSQARSPGKPASYLELFQQSAARYCPGLSWTVLAAIGQIESGDGANMGPSIAGALGPMQFLPSTWQRWGITAFGEPGPPNIMDPYDAVPSAARYLCAAGATRTGGLPGAIFSYNHAGWYVSEVIALARQYSAQYG